MNKMACSMEEVSLIERLYIPEQNLLLVLDSKFSFFDNDKNYYVIIGYEADHTMHNKGKLLCGVIELEKIEDENGFSYLERLVLPFSSKVLFAHFIRENTLEIITKKEFQKEKMIFLVENGMFNLEDYISLIDQDYPVCAPLGEYHFLPKYEERIK